MPSKTTPFHIEVKTRINAKPEAVFRALVKVDAWWPKAFRNQGGKLRLEAKLGGHFAEDCGGGNGELWGVVTALQKNQRLELTGNCGMSGAVFGVFSYQLNKEANATEVVLTHSAHGDVAGKQAMYKEGWRELLGVCLKNYVEKKPKAD